MNTSLDSIAAPIFSRRGRIVLIMTHIPNAAQLAQLAVLQAAVSTAGASLTVAQSLYTGNVTAYKAAVASFKQYENFIYGKTLARAPGVIDEGNLEGV